MDNNDLLSYFMEFVPEQDKQLFQNDMANFADVDIEELMDALDVYECKTLINEDNFKPTLLEIAHKEIIQKPMYVAACWQQILTAGNTRMTITKLKDIYTALYPTCRSFCKSLQFPPGLQDVQTSMFLKRFVRELDPKD